ncbi:hypothetical protein [Aquincola tertiaricarbonis]|uniref:hypothetical protein n=1 Tax=Aquincola tertiaricarbonis TaxID=391953 RepID=UPI0006152894|nr:hypothetical protein [Aquincola tertiaricarbonis]
MSQLSEAEAEATAVALPYLSSLFGVPIPGPVTLPLDEGQQTITEHVIGLKSLRTRLGKVSGVVRTAGRDLRHRGTRAFINCGSSLYFTEDYAF